MTRDERDRFIYWLLIRVYRLGMFALFVTAFILTQKYIGQTAAYVVGALYIVGLIVGRVQAAMRKAAG